MSASLKLSLRLQDIAQSLDDVLLDVEGGSASCWCSTPTAWRSTSATPAGDGRSELIEPAGAVECRARGHPGALHDLPQG